MLLVKLNMCPVCYGFALPVSTHQLIVQFHMPALNRLAQIYANIFIGNSFLSLFTHLILAPLFCSLLLRTSFLWQPNKRSFVRSFIRFVQFDSFIRKHAFRFKEIFFLSIHSCTYMYSRKKPATTTTKRKEKNKNTHKLWPKWNFNYSNLVPGPERIVLFCVLFAEYFCKWQKRFCHNDILGYVYAQVKKS